MVSFIKNIFNRINLLIFLCIINNLGKCLPQNSGLAFGKHVQGNYDWNSRRPDLNANVPKTWLKFDKKSIDDNSKAEEVADPNEGQLIARNTKNLKRIDISPFDCGYTQNPRIVNGNVAPIGAYPWVVVIVRLGIPICAGNIIDDRWVVSAAHCFIKSNSTESLFIRIGTNNSNKGRRVRVEKIIIHPRFNVDNMYNSDICLLKTAARLPLDQNVGTICLPEYSYAEPKSTNLRVAGWGAKKFISTQMPVQLQETILPIISPKQCIERYNQKRITIYKSQICTWAIGKDACRGDSGGPAVQYENGRAYLEGIVSYGITCADRYPGIFTKLSYFLQWISYTINTNSKKKRRRTTTTTTAPEYGFEYQDYDKTEEKKKFYDMSFKEIFTALKGSLGIKFKKDQQGQETTFERSQQNIGLDPVDYNS